MFSKPSLTGAACMRCAMALALAALVLLHSCCCPRSGRSDGSGRPPALRARPSCRGHLPDAVTLAADPAAAVQAASALQGLDVQVVQATRPLRRRRCSGRCRHAGRTALTPHPGGADMAGAPRRGRCCHCPLEPAARHRICRTRRSTSMPPRKTRTRPHPWGIRPLPISRPPRPSTRSTILFMLLINGDHSAPISHAPGSFFPSRRRSPLFAWA